VLQSPGESRKYDVLYRFSRRNSSNHHTITILSTVDGGCLWRCDHFESFSSMHGKICIRPAVQHRPDDEFSQSSNTQYIPKLHNAKLVLLLLENSRPITFDVTYC